MKTVTFETAKRLYDLGVRISNPDHYYNVVNLWLYSVENMLARGIKLNEKYIPAPDAQELLDAFIFLKAWYMGNEYTPAYDIEPFIDIYIIVFKIRLEHDWLVHTKKSKSFSEALAEMLIWLIENKYVTVEQINKGE